MGQKNQCKKNNVTKYVTMNREYSSALQQWVTLLDSGK